jgi:ribosomal protein L44E
MSVRLVFVCDRCGAESARYAAKSLVALGLLKGNGWTGTVMSNHYCPTCSRDRAQEQSRASQEQAAEVPHRQP